MFFRILSNPSSGTGVFYRRRHRRRPLNLETNVSDVDRLHPTLKDKLWEGGT